MFNNTGYKRKENSRKYYMGSRFTKKEHDFIKEISNGNVSDFFRQLIKKEYLEYKKNKE